MIGGRRGRDPSATAIVVMGVAGSGKSTLGAALAARLGLPFVDADDLHPPDNVAKMASGVPLDDADRAPWLDAVGHVLAERPVVVACSALARRYRDRLRRLAPGLRLIFLDGDPTVLRERLLGRPGHFMPAALLDSQLETLERPAPDERAVVVDVALSVDAAVDLVGRRVGGTGRNQLRGGQSGSDGSRRRWG